MLYGSRKLNHSKPNEAWQYVHLVGISISSSQIEIGERLCRLRIDEKTVNLAVCINLAVEKFSFDSYLDSSSHFLSSRIIPLNLACLAVRVETAWPR